MFIVLITFLTPYTRCAIRTARLAASGLLALPLSSTSPSTTLTISVSAPTRGSDARTRRRRSAVSWSAPSQRCSDEFAQAAGVGLRRRASMAAGTRRRRSRPKWRATGQRGTSCGAECCASWGLSPGMHPRDARWLVCLSGRAAAGLPRWAEPVSAMLAM